VGSSGLFIDWGLTDLDRPMAVDGMADLSPEIEVSDWQDLVPMVPVPLPDDADFF